MKKIAAIMAAISIPLSVAAGPLGLDMGTPLDTLQAKVKLKTEGPNYYSTPSLPDGHPDFNDYRLVITPKHGLCKFSAWTPGISTSVYGNELLSSFDRLYSALTAKYGSAKRFDFLRSGSIWKDDRDWMMALLKKERSLVAYWTEKELQLPDNISAIKLEAYANNTSTGMIALGYEFKNASDCIDWIRAAKDSKL